MHPRNEAHATERPLHSESGFVARIEGTDLGHFVQMECMAGASRTLEVESNGRTGYVFVEQGLVVHAVAGHHSGEAAVYEMLRWTVGTIRSCGNHRPEDHTIRTSWQGLLIQAAHAEDESRRSGKVVPFPDVSSSAPPPPPTSSTRVSRPPPVPADARPREVPRMASDDTADGRSIPVGVRLDARGHVLTQRGDVEALAPTAAYARRIACLIGEELGLEGFVGLTCDTPERRLLVFVDGEDLVATEPKRDAPIEPLLARLGLD